MSKNNIDRIVPLENVLISLKYKLQYELKVFITYSYK